VATERCPIEICVRCEGAWLDAGELELLEGASIRASTGGPKSAGSLQGWEIPPATDTVGVDPYSAPGQTHALSGPGPARVMGLICRHCETQVAGEDAFAFDGELFCIQCRPEGAVRGSDALTLIDRLGRWLKARGARSEVG
jgi:hypothetical protein